MFWTCSTLAYVSIIVGAKESTLDIYLAQLYHHPILLILVPLSMYTFVGGSCSMYVLFLTRIQTTFKDTGYEYSAAVVRGVKMVLGLVYVAMAVFIIYALSASQNVSEKQREKNVFMQSAILLMMFLLDFFGGLLLIFLFAKRLFMLLKQSYKETYRSKAYVHKLAKNALQMKPRHSPEMNNDAKEENPSDRKSTVPFQSSEIDLVKTITKYTFLNGLCVIVKTSVQVFLGAVGLSRSKIRYFILSSFACICVCIILWTMYLQTSFGATLYDKHCRICHLKCHECVGSLSKASVKAELQMSISSATTEMPCIQEDIET
ncbi:hypothetical protein RFI_23750 [Reticulomyxa filosa]|uniref:Uncharacterized protein n=1 Tax=Reticulomyxa filosa TaxID=46433 RepID=X6MHX9_RETFI|nr:hypothetical protein RFI_23750 [Reticulomyxa filosa]|eukprot:ETO13618.1 hypothetical protein RFI_23750 [Reticulomyxa filosa]